jgi:hypothetical protein
MENAFLKNSRVLCEGAKHGGGPVRADVIRQG